MSKIQTKQAVPVTYYDLCNSCGDELYPKADKNKMNGITVHAGTCGRCGNKGWLIPIRDFKYASGYPGYDWD